MALSPEAEPAREEIAVGLIVADDGRVLLQHRDDTPGLPGVGLWGFFGGHMEPGERPAAAFLREMQEELGWQPRHFEHYLTREAPPLPGVPADLHEHRSHVFAAHLDVALDALTLGEGQGFALLPPDALPAAIVPGLAPIIQKFAKSDAYKRVKHAWEMIGTTALIVDARGRFLLQLRDDKPEIVNPGLWGSFGGRLEPHETPYPETPDDGFLRELREELSWQPRHFELYMSAPFRTLDQGDAGRQLIYVYAAALDVDEEELVLGEGQAMGLFAADALPEPIVPALRGLIQRFADTEIYRAMVDVARSSLGA
ncbi:MAG: NUDIX domain-containing protein [Chloroflexota bacterium]|nr:NUDIX domain-containing protein [Chloroflexota bacterium]